MPRRQTTNGDNERSKSGFTPFLWVAIVCKESRDVYEGEDVIRR